MSFFTSNRFLAIVLFIGFGTAYVTIPALLQQIKDATKAPTPEPAPPAKTLRKDSENALNIETLRTLADGYSYDLRISAIKIVASRVARSRSRDLLLHDLASKNYHRREDAINALHLLTALSDTVGDQFRDAKSIAAVVKALINVLPQHWQHEAAMKGKDRDSAEDQKWPFPPSPIRPAFRPAQENALLMILHDMIHCHSRRDYDHNHTSNPSVGAALSAGLVTRWLAKYPFPCTRPENSWLNYKRVDITALFNAKAWYNDDVAMASIFGSIKTHPLGAKQLRQAGLSAEPARKNINLMQAEHDSWNARWDSSMEFIHADDVDEDEDEDHDVRMVNGEDTAGLLPVPDNITLWEEPTGRPTTRAGARLRSAERSQEEEHRRRRRREAVVVAEPGAPLRRENILQRENSQPLLPLNGNGDGEGELNGLLRLSAVGSTVIVQEPDHDSHPDQPVHASVENIDLVPSEASEEPHAMVEEEEEEEEVAQEIDRAQRRHRAIEQLIEEDQEIQGGSIAEASSETPDAASTATGSEDGR